MHKIHLYTLMLMRQYELMFEALQSHLTELARNADVTVYINQVLYLNQRSSSAASAAS